MNRRQALQLLTTGMALPLVSRKLVSRKLVSRNLVSRHLLAPLREARALLDTQPTARTLNAHQQATVRTMAELILPKTDTPGATDVGACEFIDLVMTEWYDEPERALFLNGLADVDVRARSLFGKDFVDCSPPEQADLLTALGEQMTEEVARVGGTVRQNRRSLSRPVHSFYSAMRQLTLVAYYTSEAGATAELHFEVIPERHDACVAVGPYKGPESQ
jgi:hypothetical protein